MRLIDINDIPSEVLDGIVKNEKLDLPNTHITVRSILEMHETVEAIPKADYEARLKADMVAMLEEFDLRLSEYEDADLIRVEYIRQDIQDKIDTLKGENK